MIVSAVIKAFAAIAVSPSHDKVVFVTHASDCFHDLTFVIFDNFDSFQLLPSNKSAIFSQLNVHVCASPGNHLRFLSQSRTSPYNWNCSKYIIAQSRRLWHDICIILTSFVCLICQSESYINDGEKTVLPCPRALHLQLSNKQPCELSGQSFALPSSKT